MKKEHKTSFKKVFNKNKIKPKKSLGQNFLHDKNIINKIVKIGNISEDKVVLEIGPGSGNLTNEIIAMNPKKLIAIEKDANLIEINPLIINYSCNAKKVLFR